VKRLGLSILFCGLSCQFVLADASYQETTQITGGSLLQMMKMAGTFSARAREAGKPITSKVMIHGNRMVRTNPRTTEIIDLDKKTITYVDLEKQQYSEVTFDQLRDAMARASERMKESKQKSGDGGNNANVSFNAKVQQTGATKQIDGREAKEATMTLSMDASSNDGSNAKGGLALASDLWLVESVPGYDEVRQFNTRLAQELAVDLGAGGMTQMLASQPGATKAMADLRKETAKMSGIPVLQVSRMGMTTDGQPLTPPSADAPPPAAANDDSQKQSGLGALGKAIGGSSFGGFRKHKSNDSEPDKQSSNNNNSSGGALLETRTEVGNFSDASVSTSSFDVPAGYKQVESPMVKH
jgi:hypothetical protein